MRLMMALYCTPFGKDMYVPLCSTSFVKNHYLNPTPIGMSPMYL
jgi:hypothetical protein